ncbi:dihydroxyacetone kinase subunit DhaK [Rhizobium sp. ARZ01]|uniref:dihydroxyacetone kinase subunit DhaK n=1 Tax=Rhizobium sp. ARZ01 TaxID=2769313 RepID=UPI001782A35B|nr:dihydroxyacetone kinase subunit DhaK [Rhizobium sp. ARZ01]MBD9375480.1 dihydroxyacetone kinase subunit DhaK [Rhizobium sp. ARZ01]
MKKFMNNPSNYVDESLSGLVAAHPDLVRAGQTGRTIVRRNGARRGKVGIATGGGSGHLPLFCGYIGHGLLDSCAVGNVFEGPTLQSCVDAIDMADGGAGVLLLYGNYGGDRMNFEMAAKMASVAAVRSVLGTDDVASAPRQERQKRRGVAGLVLAFKSAGAAAEAGACLDDVARIAEKTIASTYSIGLAWSGCRLPAAEAPLANMGSNEVELGIGIHGEPGIWRKPMGPADALVDEMVERLVDDRGTQGEGDRAILLVNNLGATPVDELYIAVRRAHEVLTARRITIAHSFVGSFATSMEMAGLSISICFVDRETEPLFIAPAASPFWRVQ